MAFDLLSFLMGKSTGTGGGGGSAALGSKTIRQNGVYRAASDNLDGYNTVTVEVPNSYVAADNGKVVSNGALTAQTSRTVTENGTYDTTTNDEVVVNVSGGTAKVEEKDVDFIDYDGTLLYSYTAAEFLAMSAMPVNPSHTGLVAQGWNWTFADAKEYVEAHGFLVIGQSYTTSDGKTRIYITLEDDDDMSPQMLIFRPSVRGGVTVDWGDGESTTAETAYDASGSRYVHQYASKGSYVITLTADSGTYGLGYSGSNQGIFWPNDAQYKMSAFRVRKIEIGDDATSFLSQPFIRCGNLESIAWPTTCNLTGDLFGSVIGIQMKGIVFPSGGTRFSIGNTALYLGEYVSIPKSVTTIVRSIYYYNVRKLAFPDGVTSLPPYTLRNARSLKRLSFPAQLTAIPNNACGDVSRLSSVIIPAEVTSIGSLAFQNALAYSEIHLLPTTPPTLANTNAFPNTNNYTKFYVPYSSDHSVLTAYQEATNWSTFASKMVEESA